MRWSFEAAQVLLIPAAGAARWFRTATATTAILDGRAANSPRIAGLA
jgi:hypothetical protein